MKKGGVYLASHELHVCATFSRSFFWTDLNLWPEDLAPGSAVLLSGRDDLMNAQQVKAMLEEFKHIKVGTQSAQISCDFCQIHTVYVARSSAGPFRSADGASELCGLNFAVVACASSYANGYHAVEIPWCHVFSCCYVCLHDILAMCRCTTTMT
jgi:hypothetical protein